MRLARSSTAFEAIRQLPDDVSYEDIMERVLSIQRVELGLRDMQEGRISSLSQATSILLTWEGVQFLMSPDNRGFRAESKNNSSHALRNTELRRDTAHRRFSLCAVRCPNYPRRRSSSLISFVARRSFSSSESV
jgi:hypothetical protein